MSAPADKWQCAGLSEKLNEESPEPSKRQRDFFFLVKPALIMIRRVQVFMNAPLMNMKQPPLTHPVVFLKHDVIQVAKRAGVHCPSYSNLAKA